MQNTTTTWSYDDTATAHTSNFTYQARIIDTANNVGTTASQAITIDTSLPAAVATVTALSSDTGMAGDFITTVASQTVSGTFTGTLGAGEKIQVSSDGGTTWVDATSGAGTWSASGVTLSAGSGTVSVRTIDTASNTTAGTGHSYTLNSTAPEFIVPTATVNILTNAGYDLSTLYANMHSSDPTSGVRDSTHFTSPNVGAGIVFNVIGNGLTYSVSGSNFQILSGTITALEIRNLSDNSLLVSMTGITFAGADFGAAVGAYPDTTALDSLFKTIAYMFTGGSGPDVAVGGNLNDTFIGGGGNDTLNGGAGLDRAIYTDATGPITVNMVAGTVSGAGVGNDTLVSVESIRGSAFADTYVATGYAGASAIGSVPAGFNEFEGMAGNDVITGNGNTALSYLNATSGVTVDIAAGIATGDASVGTDTFTGVQIVRGSGFADTLLGSNNAPGTVEVFEGRGGNDFIDGRGGFDRVIYGFRTDNDVTGAITVNLAAGTVVGDASVGTDTLRSIEAVRGTDFNDVYDATGFTASSTNAGSAGVNNTGAAFNEFEGLGGNDTITGNGNTRISYINAKAGVTVDLASPTVGIPGSTGIAHGTAPGDVAGIGTDTIFGGVNSIIGSNFADTLSGSNNASGTAEVFDGAGGNDTIDGRGGFDQAVYNGDLGTASGISVNMAAGTVVGDASIGTDTLRAVESIRGTNFADTYDASQFGQAGALNIGSFGTFNDFEGMGGNDTIIGNGNTRLSFVSATGGVTVDLVAGIATGDASVGTDTFTGVSQVRGSAFNDTITGDANNNVLDGQGGLDRALYTNATGPITVNMAAGTVSGAGVGNDALISIELIRGSAFDDSYVATGYTGVSAIGSVPARFNEFEGMAGNDVITGNGNTFLSYMNATEGVTVNFTSGWDKAHGTAPGDVANVGTDTFYRGAGCPRLRSSLTRCWAVTMRPGRWKSLKAAAVTTSSMAAAALTA